LDVPLAGSVLVSDFVKGRSMKYAMQCDVMHSDVKDYQRCLHLATSAACLHVSCSGGLCS
jgi:hypothetical protein